MWLNKKVREKVLMVGLGTPVLTPSPVPPRLMKAAVACPLPQGGEGCAFKTTRRIFPKGDENIHHKCRNFRAGLKPRPSKSVVRPQG